MNNQNVIISELTQTDLTGALFPLRKKGSGEFVTNEHGFVQLVGWGVGDLRANSLLRKDEWEELDRAVVQAASERLNFVDRMRSLGLVKTLTSIGVLASQWNVGSQMTRAVVNLSGRSAPDLDRQDYNLKGVPVPVIHKEFQIGMRELEASRRLGEGIDTTNAYQASRVVAEELERTCFGGNSAVVLNGQSIYGVTNEPNVNTGAATGDFGTIANINTTFTAMINACAADNYHGPFEGWVSTNQYNEMTTAFYTDGSGESAFERMLRMPQLRAIHPGDYLTDGALFIAQMTPDVLDIAIYQLNTVVEWPSGDGMTRNFKVMSIAVPRVKSDYSSQSGICYYTGA
jgi:uncharacterized linocin/CFP29 family protein